ncbi:hypothetical protein CVT25_007415 [Psilocybe cyanescens]|uniref:Uncharacterized protein n=1 Tax=Psilocybe cyanescens TaxID=93625 RepID=A0A409XGC7_PSICY|nr:hypothetical protein CVT25_007415 [Psilocybe cyanescens]
MDATILGMDPINFALTVISVLGLLFSIIAFVRHFDPSTGQWLTAAEGMDHIRSYLESISPILSIRHEHRLRLYVNRMEHKLALLMLGTMPFSNGPLQNLKGWIKTWRLLWLSKEIHACSVILRMISTQKERVKHAKHDEMTMDPLELEASVEASIERLIMSLPVRPSTTCQQADLEANHPPAFLSNYTVRSYYSDVVHIEDHPTSSNIQLSPRQSLDIDSNTSTLCSGSRESLPKDGCTGNSTKTGLSYRDLPMKPPSLHLPTVRKLRWQSWPTVIPGLSLGCSPLSSEPNGVCPSGASAAGRCQQNLFTAGQLYYQGTNNEVYCYGQ